MKLHLMLIKDTMTPQGAERRGVLRPGVLQATRAHKGKCSPHRDLGCTPWRGVGVHLKIKSVFSY
ncbi:hypothetical protein [Xanthomonas vesicatoria]|uniref:Uncharacterized protein n=1 Tax=Xanthomonas vesicatoria TaxID=56460 RepID=A0ABS8L8J3_9XANT|nr:hypothetical protein [Xanthomonas vesicatoria]MCC8622059.1 hypothetical protein [Xanthomonas vesicatoria]MCC8695835.1 hypothetical protein [Xanthomonas vesicatoria]MCC8704430.1 hypothetical protein [Xanthomonas vesicatoria]MDG4488142.1 hypothetical protein [Xanthomonas vesicatoria]